MICCVSVAFLKSFWRIQEFIAIVEEKNNFMLENSHEDKWFGEDNFKMLNNHLELINDDIEACRSCWEESSLRLVKMFNKSDETSKHSLNCALNRTQRNIFFQQWSTHGQHQSPFLQTKWETQSHRIIFKTETLSLFASSIPAFICCSVIRTDSSSDWTTLSFTEPCLILQLSPRPFLLEYSPSSWALLEARWRLLKERRIHHWGHGFTSNPTECWLKVSPSP